MREASGNTPRAESRLVIVSPRLGLILDRFGNRCDEGPELVTAQSGQTPLLYCPHPGLSENPDRAAGGFWIGP
jgi:hypothetical protein